MWQRWRDYWTMIKSLQSGLLLLTGAAGYLSVHYQDLDWGQLGGLLGSLGLAICGGTVLNMWYDRDIDARMPRACKRPLPAGRVAPAEALGVGMWLSLAGVGWALALDGLYGAVVLAGWFCDVIVYTAWLKRRTAWSVVWGGIAGGMPALAGRCLAIGGLDWIGALLALAVLLWIPTHILTFSMRRHADYCAAGVPTFPQAYGFPASRAAVAAASLLAALAMGLAAYGIGVAEGALHLLAVLSAGLLVISASALLRPSERLNFGLFKYASAYMLGAMLLLAV